MESHRAEFTLLKTEGVDDCGRGAVIGVFMEEIKDTEEIKDIEKIYDTEKIYDSV